MGQINRLYSPFGSGIMAIITAYNYTGIIPTSSVSCDNKLDCLQSMCYISHLPYFNHMKIMFRQPPLPTCNLTITTSARELYQKWFPICIIILVVNIINIVSIIITWILYKTSYFIIFISVTFMTTIATLILMMLLGLDVIANSLKQLPYDTTGTITYDTAHVSIILGTYLVMTISFILSFIFSRDSVQEPVSIPDPLLESEYIDLSGSIDNLSYNLLYNQDSISDENQIMNTIESKSRCTDPNSYQDDSVHSEIQPIGSSETNDTTIPISSGN